MNAVLSVQGTAVSEETKPSFLSRVFNKKKALKVAKVALPVAVKWVVLAEVIAGGIMYMMTKNVKFLFGFAIISTFITIGMSVAGY